MMRALGIAAFGTLLLSGCEQFSHTVTVTRDQMQAVVDAMVPVDLQEKAGLPFPATLTAAEVILEDGSSTIGLKISFSAEPPAPPAPPRPPVGLPPGLPGDGDAPKAGAPVIGVVAITGNLRFDGGEGAFYFTNPSVEELQATDLPAAHSSPLSKAAEKIVGEYLERNPVYTLDNESLSNRAAKALLKSMEIREGQLHVTLGL